MRTRKAINKIGNMVREYGGCFGQTRILRSNTATLLGLRRANPTVVVVGVAPSVQSAALALTCPNGVICQMLSDKQP